MLVLAMGSNQGDRAGFLSKAVRSLLREGIIQGPCRISPCYQAEALVPAGAPPSWNQDYLNVLLEAKTSLPPPLLLKELKSLETRLGRLPSERWAPREIDLDIVFYGSERLQNESLQIPHPEWEKRSFWLKPLADLYPTDSRFQRPGDPLRVERIPLQILASELVGILNITPDSFSDGGQIDSPRAFERRLGQMIEAGASTIDIGAESTRPGAKSLSAVEEWSRLEGVLPLLVSKIPAWMKWSLDSRRLEVMQRAAQYTPDFWNDVSSAQNAGLLDFWRGRDEPVILMHQLGIPADRSQHLSWDCDPVEEVCVWGEQTKERWERAGLDLSRLILDPGIGFGKTAEQSTEILRRIEELSALNAPIYVGHSRKSFLNLISSRAFSDRDLESAVVSSQLSSKACVDYLRVHDVEMSARAMRAAMLNQ